MEQVVQGSDDTVAAKVLKGVGDGGECDKDSEI